jgi:hypothetical protein
MHRPFVQTTIRSRVKTTPRLRSIFRAFCACKTVNFRGNETQSRRFFHHPVQRQRLIILARDPPRPARR